MKIFLGDWDLAEEVRKALFLDLQTELANETRLPIQWLMCSKLAQH
jgi:hypothetical protein